MECGSPETLGFTLEALRFALTAEDQPVRQFWLVGESDGALTGVIHAMLLPVPPIYAGAFGPPGLILADSQTATDAPAGTVDALVAAAEEAMRAAGAELLLSSFVTGATWQTAFAARGYDPLTLYLSRTDLGEDGSPSGVRAATEDDVPGIVIRSAENRQVLSGIDAFWEPHPEADARFAAWMTRSLTLRDREMLVAGDPDRLEGYVIAQPASRMHFPPAHDIRGTGVVDDYFHPDFGAPAMLAEGGAGAIALLRAAEAAFAARAWARPSSSARRAGHRSWRCWGPRDTTWPWSGRSNARRARRGRPAGDSRARPSRR